MSDLWDNDWPINPRFNSAFKELVFENFRLAMASSISTSTARTQLFTTRVSNVISPKSDINALILDYLTMEGYPKAAAKFSKEANLQPQQDEAFISMREQIQEAIHMGDIEVAIAALNDLDHEILDDNPDLHFALLRLQLVELIRLCNGGDITSALNFASQKLAPRAATDPRFLKDLEQTMALLIFPHDDTLQPELAALLRPDLRSSTATQVNQAILQKQISRRDAAIRMLVKLRAWAAQSTRDKHKDGEVLALDLGLQEDGAEEAVGDNDEPMITT